MKPDLQSLITLNNQFFWFQIFSLCPVGFLFYFFWRMGRMRGKDKENNRWMRRNEIRGKKSTEEAKNNHKTELEKQDSWGTATVQPQPNSVLSSLEGTQIRTEAVTSIKIPGPILSCGSLFPNQRKDNFLLYFL